MDGDELCAIWEGPFHRHFTDELFHASHHLVPAEHGLAEFHHLGHGLAVADEL